MKKFFLRMAAVIFILSGIAFGGYSLYKSSFFHLQTIAFEYSEKSSYILTLSPLIEARLSLYKGLSLWDIDIFKIEQDIKKQSWIENVIISRQFPNEIRIKIQPKKIIANILRSPSKIQPVAEDATLLQSTEITKAPSAPMLSNSAFYRDESLRKKALEFLRELPAEGAFSQETVSEIFPHKNDEFRVLLKKSKAQILINNENVPLKAQRISKVIQYLDDREMIDRVIDSNFSKKVLVRPRNSR